MFYTGFKVYQTLKYMALQHTAETTVRWEIQRQGGHWKDLNGDAFGNEALPLIDRFKKKNVYV